MAAVHEYLIELFQTAVNAAHPSVVVPPLLNDPVFRRGPVTVVGAGKAAVGMTRVVCDKLDVRSGVIAAYGWRPHSGSVECNRPHVDSVPDCGAHSAVETSGSAGLPDRFVHSGVYEPSESAGDFAVPESIGPVAVIRATHPLPAESGAHAARRMIEMVSGLGPDDTVLCLVSGGGSALAALPVSGVSIDEKAAVVRALLAAGAPIQDINCVRRHLSRIKGGRLAVAAAPAKVITIAISDVVGDEPSAIASGPTVPDPTSLGDALDVLIRHRIAIPPSVLAALNDPSNETPFPGDPMFSRCAFRLAAGGETAIGAAINAAREAELGVINLGASVTGDSRHAAAAHAAMIRELRKVNRRCLVLSGGETTTIVRADHGRGGSNTEFLLALAMELRGMPDVWALAADTDGIDGSGYHAGAWFDAETMQRAAGLGLDPQAYLNNGDSATFFERTGGLVVTGPTGTNVNDFRAILLG